MILSNPKRSGLLSSSLKMKKYLGSILVVLALFLVIAAPALADDVLRFTIGSTVSTTTSVFDVALPTSGTKFLAFEAGTSTPTFMDIDPTEFEWNTSANQLEFKAAEISQITGLTASIDAINASIATKATPANITSAISPVQDQLNTVATNNFIRETYNQRVRAQTNSSGTYTWTYTNAYASGTTPIIAAVAEDSSGGALTNVQITSISNTSVTVQARRVSTILGVLTLTTNPQVYVHLRAVGPQEI